MFIDRKEVGKPNQFKVMSDEEPAQSIKEHAEALGFEITIPTMPATRVGSGTKH
jgi:hypothetical protein